MLKVTITAEIIEWLYDYLGYDADSAEEFAQMFIEVLQTSGGISTASPDTVERGIEIDTIWCPNCGEEIRLP